VFFNEAARVLQEPFERQAILVARSGPRGPSIVRKGQIEKILNCFAPGSLQCIVNLRAAPDETFVSAEAFRHPDVRHVDLVDRFAKRYPGGKTPSSGYAVSVWLAGSGLACDVVLTGFTAQRSRSWKVLDIHAWTFEQMALRMYEAEGALRFWNEREGPSLFEALRAEFPDAGDERIVALGLETVSRRLENTDYFVDRLWSLARVGRGVRSLLQAFRRRP
jgi:hypothetical protein